MDEATTAVVEELKCASLDFREIIWRSQKGRNQDWWDGALTILSLLDDRTLIIECIDEMNDPSLG